MKCIQREGDTTTTKCSRTFQEKRYQAAIKTKRYISKGDSISRAKKGKKKNCSNEKHKYGAHWNFCAHCELAKLRAGRATEVNAIEAHDTHNEAKTKQ